MSDLIVEQRKEAMHNSVELPDCTPETTLEWRAAAELERLTAENDALRADAERLLSALINLRAVAGRYLPDYDEHPTIQDADAAIDAARAKETGDG